ncbi:MAG: transcription termination/antitermination protein NusG [Planctomycetota bacterium]|nr:MAG: transcription termination/antitermination protein NusG [Planctomycetota bacterium]
MTAKWYVLRVQSGKEDSSAENLLKRAKLQGLDNKLLRVFVPRERVAEIKGGKKRTKEIKKYPGYVMVLIETSSEEKDNPPVPAKTPQPAQSIPKDLWYLIKETPGVGDFLGGNAPQPMADEEMEKLLKEEEKQKTETTVKIDFQKGDRVKIKEGPFQNFDGIVEEICPQRGIVKVVVTIFGRSTPVDLEYWEVERT